jgi:hypothetical protein
MLPQVPSHHVHQAAAQKNRGIIADLEDRRTAMAQTLSRDRAKIAA